MTLSMRTPFALALASTCALSGLSAFGLSVLGMPAAHAAIAVAYRPSPVGSYLAGRFAEKQDDWRSAQQFMTDALAAAPDDVSLQHRTLLLRIGEGQIAEALPLARALFTAGAESPMPALLLAADHLKAGAVADAETAVKAIRPEGIGRLISVLMRTWIAAARGDTDGALAQLAPLALVNGMKPLYGLHSGLINELAGRSEAAAARYAELSGPDAPLRIVQVVGSFYERTGRRDAARSLYLAFRDRDPDSAVADPLLAALDAGGTQPPVIASAADGMAEALFDIASALQHDAARDHSLLYAQLALHLRPDLGLARLLVADLLADRPDASDAVAAYRALSSHPVLGRMARQRLADTLAEQNRTDEAIAILKQLDAERPDQTRAIVRLGDIYRTAKRWDEAVSVYSEALSRIGTPEERHWPILYARGIANERTNRWPEAEADFKAALVLRPEEPFVLNYLGYSWIDRGLHLAEAKRMVERAVELRPRDGYIVDSLGWALYRLGDIEGAVTTLERAVELKSLDATINDHLGDAYWRAGRRNEARFQWQRALKNAESDADGEKLKAEVQLKLEKGLTDPQTAGAAPAATR